MYKINPDCFCNPWPFILFYFVRTKVFSAVRQEMMSHTSFLSLPLVLFLYYNSTFTPAWTRHNPPMRSYIFIHYDYYFLFYIICKIYLVRPSHVSVWTVTENPKCHTVIFRNQIKNKVRQRRLELLHVRITGQQTKDSDINNMRSSILCVESEVNEMTPNMNVQWI